VAQAPCFDSVEQPESDGCLMETLLYLMPIALVLGGLGLAAFVWALRSGQYEDMDGAAERVLVDD
jgi:cbb3-type cytochrome oxidase maturation protein